MNAYLYPCKFCGKEHDIHLDLCPETGDVISERFNVKMAGSRQQQTALHSRYEQAKAELEKKGLADIGYRFEEMIKTRGTATVNTNMAFVWKWLVEASIEYENYRSLVVKGLRKRALYANDRQRAIVDSIIHGSNTDFQFAALSTSRIGVTSYGPLTILLHTKLIANITTALEENSFYFVDKMMEKGFTIETGIPAGYLCQWGEIHKLALAKRYRQLLPMMTENQMSELILKSEGDRATDEFIELFIASGQLRREFVDVIRIERKTALMLSPENAAKLEELKKIFTVEEY